MLLVSSITLRKNIRIRIATITKTRRVGFKNIAGIQTSTGTFITGGYLSHNTYQFVTRDTFGIAVKATYGVVAGQPREIFKSPKTDSGMKVSATGLLRVEYENGDYVLYDRQTPEQEEQGALVEVFRDSKLLKKDSVDKIRKRLYTKPEQPSHEVVMATEVA